MKRFARIVSPWTAEVVLSGRDELVEAGMELAQRRAAGAALNAIVRLRFGASIDDVLASVYLQGVRDAQDAAALKQGSVS